MKHGSTIINSVLSDSKFCRQPATRCMLLLLLSLLLMLTTTTSFAPDVVRTTGYSSKRFPKNDMKIQLLLSIPATTSTSTRLYAELPDIKSMRVGEIRNELESYGISTKSFLEKKEMVAALEKARAEGKTPNAKTATKTKTTADYDAGERYKKAFEDALTMRVAELKQALTEMGVDSRAFIEKSEFIKAYAEAVRDGKQASQKQQPHDFSYSQNFNNGSSSNARDGNYDYSQKASMDEPYDFSYRDVVMQKIDRRDPRLMQGTIIDV